MKAKKKQTSAVSRQATGEQVKVDKQNKDKKKQELIEENKNYDVPKRGLPKTQNLTIRPFLDSTFQQIINEGMKEVLKKRPQDPIHFLGEFLLSNSKFCYKLFKKGETFAFLQQQYSNLLITKFQRTQLMIVSNQYNYQITEMGNQQSVYKQNTYIVRHRTLDQSQYSNKKITTKKNSSSRQNNSFEIPPIDYHISRQVKHASEKEQSSDNENDPQESQLNRYSGKVNNRYNSIDFSDLEEKSRVRYRQTPKKSDNDRILENLGKKNQTLRKELKKISDDLSNQLKKKKFIPKKKITDNKGSDDEEEQSQVVKKQMVGLKRQLENGYKQIEMYKKVLAELRGKDEGDKANFKLNKVQNQINTMDVQIEKYQQKIKGLKKIQNKQEVQIEMDINDDLKEGVLSYKKQITDLKKKQTELQQRDRQRELNYKKQQAYLCDLEKKLRQVNGDYFPHLSTQVKKGSDFQKQRVNPKQFLKIQEEAEIMKYKHEEYYRKIDLFLKGKNRSVEDQNYLKEQVLYKERVIDALKVKIEELKKIMKPSKRGYFGYGNSSFEGSEYNQTPSEIERQIEEEVNQDQFDIKHLIANIPKPVRKRPEEVSNGMSSGGLSSPAQKGIPISSTKAAPKKWGESSTRTEERGKHFKAQLNFEDRAQFQEDIRPKVVGMNMWVNKNNSILGIQAIYMHKHELRYGIKSCDAIDGVIKRFDLKSPDYLKNFSITINDDGFVQSIQLNSKEGKVGKFGNKRDYDEQINFGLASNERPFMFSGATTLFDGEPRLNVIGAQICFQ